jgi:uncharacterized protein (TIGR02757 family)
MTDKTCQRQIFQDLESLYCKLNHRKYVHPDPLEFLYDYPDVKDREIAGLIASALAYGRVAGILAGVDHVLKIIGPSPARYVKKESAGNFEKTFDGFVYRFARGTHVASLVAGIKQVVEKYGSLNNCFLDGFRMDHENTLVAMDEFVRRLTQGNRYDPGHLLPLPCRGSACKRLNLFLRWMVRKDEVDPGGWEGIPGSKLIIPLDVHMHRIGKKLGFTRRKQADMRTALEITEQFRNLCPDDPVKYDFALTRMGIWMSSGGG